MPKSLFLVFFLASALAAQGTPDVPGAATPAVPPPTPYGATPTMAQLAWHAREIIGILHLSTATYAGKEWGYGDESPAIFNPDAFDARQIAQAARAGKLSLLVMVAKHHGGFCLWPSPSCPDYTIRNTPWKRGRGDMLYELVAACRAERLGVGMYLSPWDRHHKDYGRDAYVAYYHQQLRELLGGRYGEILEVWFDGANGGDGWYGGAREKRSIGADYYQWDKIHQIVHTLQPRAVCFGGHDVRWVGNEAGIAGDPCWATVNDPDQDLNRGVRNGKLWRPAEADFPLRSGWFWHADDKPKSPGRLVDLYFASVGRNAVMDIGLAPDVHGRMSDDDVAALAGFGRRLDAIFMTNLARGARVTASNVRGNSDAYAVAKILKCRSKFGDYWATDDEVKDAEIVLDFGKPTEFSVVSLREPIQLGQRIDGWALDVCRDGAWQEFAKGTGIGARRLWRGQPIASSKIRLRLIQASASPALSEFAVYLEPEASRKEAGTLAPMIETGLSRADWKVVRCSAEGAESGLAQFAIDGNPATFWHTHAAAGRQPPPQEIVLDLGKVLQVTGLLYLPRQDACKVGNVTHYLVATSLDGQGWSEAARGEFGNIAANPVQQKVAFKQPAQARYLKFTATGAIDGCVNAAEIGILGK